MKESEITREIKNRVSMLDSVESRRLNKANRRTLIINGLLILFMFLPPVLLGLLADKWKLSGFLNAFSISIWILLVTFLERQINRKDYTIAMMSGITRIGDDMREQIAAESVKGSSNASTNAKRNRKK
jgi:hypothetical protein